MQLLKNFLSGIVRNRVLVALLLGVAGVLFSIYLDAMWTAEALQAYAAAPLSPHPEPIWHKLVTEGLGRIGEMLILGGVIDGLLNADNYANYFLEKVQKVVLGKAFLGERKDHLELWTNISVAMLSERFRTIQNEFADKLRIYLVEDLVYFLRNYDTSIDLKPVEGEPSKVLVKEVTEFDVVTDFPRKEIPFRFERYPGDPTGEKPVIQMSVDGGGTVEPVLEFVKDGVEHYKLTLKDREVYKLIITRSMVQNLSVDPLRSFSALGIVQNIKVGITFADGIGVIWQTSGMTEGFKDAPCSKTNEIRKRYDGIALKNQGYAIIIQRFK